MIASVMLLTLAVASAVAAPQQVYETLEEVELGGCLAEERLFAGRAQLAFSPDGSFLCLADRFGRSVQACDTDGRKLWKVAMPAGIELSEIEIDASGRLLVRPRGRAEIWIYEQPGSEPRIVPLPDGWPGDLRADLLRADRGVLLWAYGERRRLRLDRDYEVAGIDTLAAPDADLWAHGPDGSFWFYRDGERRIQGGRNGTGSIQLDRPLSTRSLLAVGPDGMVWLFEAPQGELSSYASNGLPRRAYRVEPIPADPVGMWIDPSAGVWIADGADGRVHHYAP